MSQLPPLEDFRVFVTAARLGGFSAAADQLVVSPAYISKRIGLLEERLGVKLFMRASRSVCLTLEGKIALEWAERLLETHDQLRAELNREQELPRGRLRVVTSTGFGMHCIAPIMSDLAFRYPDLQIDLELLDRPVDLVSEGFDLEIRIGGVLPEQMIAKRLANNQRILCAAPSYLEKHGFPTFLEDLKRHQCIGIRERDQSYGIWRLAKEDEVYSIPLTAEMMTNNGAVAKQWCLKGHGIMLRSIWNVQEELIKEDLVRVLPSYGQQADIHVIYSARLETSAKLRACVMQLEQSLPGFLRVD